MTLLLFSTAGYRGSLLTTVQQMQPTLTLHCPKLVQNIKIRISRDVRVYVVVQFFPLVQFFLNWYRIY